MAKIGIIFAMKEELNELKKQILITNTETIYEYTIYEGKIKENEIYLIESGVGKVNASRGCQLLIDYKKSDYIFNIGVAGGIDPKLSIGDIIIGEKLVQHDFDITAFNHKKGYVPKVGNDISSNKELIDLAINTPSKTKKYKGIIATGDTFCTNKEQEIKIANEFQALCVEMEGASIAQVCYLCHIPFLVIRSISDSAYQGKIIEDYEQFLKESSKNVSDYLIKIIRKI